MGRRDEVEAMEELGLVPDVTTVFPNGELRRFTDLVEERRELKAMIKGAEEEVKGIDEKLTALMENRSTVKVKWGKISIGLVLGTHTSLSKEKLLEHGVSALVIAESTTSKSYTYIMVKEGK